MSIAHHPGILGITEPKANRISDVCQVRDSTSPPEGILMELGPHAESVLELVDLVESGVMWKDSLMDSLHLRHLAFRLIQVAMRLLFVVLVVVIFWGIRICFWPSNWVEVSLQNVPEGIKQIYLIGERSEGTRALPWYFSNITPIAFEPHEVGEAWERNVPSNERRANVQWLRADRYGVVAQRQDGSWMLWWPSPDGDELEGPPVWRYLWGITQARINLSEESRALVPSKELLDQLNLPEKPNPM